ncbi:MAG: class I SAM-dependent rRNA methyltransferase [Acidobacteria bacterium]|nr:class I SAM-dependent rRNA methyltransferase [Acidobacteriota bacterium]
MKPGKEKPLTAHHHWVFSGAILKRDPEIIAGAIVDVCSSDHKYLGTGYFNDKTSIAVRMLSFEPTTIDGNFFWERIYRSWQYRQKLFAETDTNAFRVVFSEGDFLPGLIVDKYGSGLVLQIQTLGIDGFRNELVELLNVMLRPDFIHERSEGAARAEEGLTDINRTLWGTLPGNPVEIRENGVVFIVDVVQGQKTGFFLDQRDNRHLIRRVAKGKTVLNCFGYTAGFAVYAALGGATRTVTVDLSEPALALAQENFRRNGLDPGRHEFVREDVFQYLRHCRDKFDIIILDPPAFAKKQTNLTAAYRGYKDINLHALKCIQPGGWLLTCSCSYYIDAPQFQKILFLAAMDAGHEVQIVAKRPQPPDHPLNVFHPESEYLKSFFCKVY